MKRSLPALALVTLVSSAQAFEDVDGSLGKLPARIRDKMTELLDLKLVDGRSSRLRRVSWGNDHVCGLVNAKSRSGSYTGYNYFAIDLANADAIILSENRPDGGKALELYEINQRLVVLRCFLSGQKPE